MSHNYKVEEVKNLAAQIKAAGFRVFLAESGTHGFYTDAEGTRLVSFQRDLGGFKFSGNYRARNAADGRSVGSGWALGDTYKVSPSGLKAMLDSCPPQWATRGITVDLTTLAQHLKTYQSSSRYTEVLE